MNVFVLGGSTTFGYGVADHQTVPSRMAEHLAAALPERKVRLYNLGQGSYYSTQERILFCQLLLEGLVPDVAVFIDGMNDFCYHPQNRETDDRLGDYFDRSFNGSVDVSVSDVVKSLPIHRAVKSVEHFLKSFRNEDHDSTVQEIESSLMNNRYRAPALINAVIDRYLKNRQIIRTIASDFGVTTVFVWQPHPTYRYDLNQHLFIKGGFRAHGYARHGYAAFAQRMGDQALGDAFLWCADLQEQSPGPNYVDEVHYTPAFCDFFAKHLVQIMIQRGLIPL